MLAIRSVANSALRDEANLTPGNTIMPRDKL